MDYKIMEESNNKAVCKLIVVAMFLGIVGYLLWFYLHRLNYWIVVKEETVQASHHHIDSLS